MRVKSQSKSSLELVAFGASVAGKAPYQPPKVSDIARSRNAQAASRADHLLELSVFSQLPCRRRR